MGKETAEEEVIKVKITRYGSKFCWYCYRENAYLWRDGTWRNRTHTATRDLYGEGWYRSKADVVECLKKYHGNHWEDVNAEPLDALASLVAECVEYDRDTN